MNSLEEVAGFLRKGKKAVICGHSMPDGDSVGSVLAMGLLLSELGIENYVVMPDPVPAMFGFLPGATDVVTYDCLPGDCDLAVVLDCTDLGRLGDELGEIISKVPVVVNIDHHISNQQFGDCNYVNAKAAASGEIVFELIKIMAVPLTEAMAVNLYTAITMDTGSFMFDNTTAKTHEITAELIRTGIDTAEINKNLFEKKDFVQLKLLGYALNNLKTAGNGTVAWVTVPLEVMKELGANDEHADGIINYPRMLNGVEIGLLFREISPHRFKVGFRSKKRVDVNRLAANFGGGGHPRAAGCVVEGNQEDVEQKVVDLCIQALKHTVRKHEVDGWC